MKDVLLLIHDDAGQDARLSAAIDVARALHGHLRCLDVSIVPVIAGGPYCGEAQAMLLQDERGRESRNRKSVEARLAKEGITWDWTDMVGAAAPCLQDRAALCDLIVVNRDIAHFPVRELRRIADDVIVKARRPVLAVPPSSRGFTVGGRVLVCWNGSPAAVAALQAAVPLLALAHAVVLLEIDDGSIAIPADEAAIYLAHHGITAAVQKEVAARAIEHHLLDAIERESIDYAVMGGFGRSRISEALFGGVTRALLRKSAIPLFLAH